MAATDLLDDAQLLNDRAQAHRHDLNHLTGIGPGRLWNVIRKAAADGTTHSADLVLDREVLRRTKPVVADIANSLIHALDHVAAAARRQANTGKSGDSK